jgi:hypothetical protein
MMRNITNGSSAVEIIELIERLPLEEATKIYHYIIQKQFIPFDNKRACNEVNSLMKNNPYKQGKIDWKRDDLYDD